MPFLIPFAYEAHPVWIGNLFAIRRGKYGTNRVPRSSRCRIDINFAEVLATSNEDVYLPNGFPISCKNISSINE
jgi:hypothetical protein